MDPSAPKRASSPSEKPPLAPTPVAVAQDESDKIIELDNTLIETVTDEETGEVKNINDRENADPFGNEDGAEIKYKTMTWQ